jgi:hypothetical protein
MSDPIKIDLDPSMAMALQVQQFDKKIAEAEAQVADLKKQRASYIFDTNVQAVLARQQKSVPSPS